MSVPNPYEPGLIDSAKVAVKAIPNTRTFWTEGWRGVKFGVKSAAIIVGGLWLLAVLVGVCILVIDQLTTTRNLGIVQIASIVGSAFAVGILFCGMVAPIAAVFGGVFTLIGSLLPANDIDQVS